MSASLARSIAEERDKGVSYDAELGKIIGASHDLPSASGIQQLSVSMLKTIYIDMPQITPEGAYKLYYVACISAN
ncbi:MAG: hypothetical protein KGQ35_12385 [Burkholderiales bacterium]|nr:hypothetical protein [Burkholderiales bacterium]